MNYDVLIGVHSYRKSNYGKDEKEVMLDRLDGALDAANRYKSLGSNVGIVYLGGYVRDGKTTAEITVEIANNNNHKLVQNFDKIIADKYGGDTTQELKSFIEFANSINPNIVVSVSSKDHVPRIMRNLTKYITSVSYGLTVYASKNTYTKNELQPFILEGTYPEFINTFEDIFTIDNKNRKNLSNEIQELINNYK